MVNIQAMKNFQMTGVMGLLGINLMFCSCQKQASVELLLSADSKARTQAVEKLTEQSGPEKEKVIPYLTSALEDPDPVRVVYAVQALKAVGLPALAAVKEKSLHRDPFVRVSATEILAFFAEQDPSLLATLEGLTSDTHPLVKEEAQMALDRLRMGSNPKHS